MSEASPSTIESIRRTLDEALYRYVSVLLSQPFDVAKTVLQVKRQDSQGWNVAARDESASSDREGAHLQREDKAYSDVWQMAWLFVDCANFFT